jgi:hypothetical protein
MIVVGLVVAFWLAVMVAIVKDHKKDLAKEGFSKWADALTAIREFNK